jgi:hypothetical protein
MSDGESPIEQLWGLTLTVSSQRELRVLSMRQPALVRTVLQ